MSDLAKDLEEALLSDSIVSRYSWLSPGTEFVIPLKDGRQVAATMVESNEADDEWSQRIWFVFKVDDRYFRRYGTYRSHYGSDWDYGAFEEVTSKTVETVVWESI